MKKTTLIFASLLALFLVIPASVSAYETRKGNSVIVAKDEVINGNLYTAGANISIEGHIKGDVFCAGQTINIKGEVDGSVFCAGQNINLDGKVAGSARMAASTININGSIGQNANAFAAAVSAGDNSKIGWDMLIGAAGANLSGEIGNDLHGGGANISLNGKVGRNVNLALGDKKDSSLTLGDKAIIGGGLTYRAAETAEISGQAKIAGETIRKEFTARTKSSGPAARAGMIIFSIFSSLIIGLVLVSVFREKIIAITDLMLNKIAASIGIGFLALILAPFAFIILAITVIGIPLSLILLVLWIIALCLSKIITGIFLGRVLVEKYWAVKKESLIWPMIIGVTVTSLICFIPFIGWVLGLIAVLWALGGMVLTLKNPDKI
ncbi:MAG: EI24 domain-containing protein [Patescibacteria group bacterium]|jgi:hypothetical protein